MAPGENGFTLTEVLVVLSVTMVLLSIAVVNVRTLSYQSVDAVAQSDYRNIKTAVLQALTNADGPAGYVANRIIGPTHLPAPFSSVSVSEGVEASVVFDLQKQNNKRPRTSTRIQIFHFAGSKSYLFTEINGRISEQVIDR